MDDIDREGLMVYGMLRGQLPTQVTDEQIENAYHAARERHGRLYTDTEQGRRSTVSLIIQEMNRTGEGTLGGSISEWQRKHGYSR